jgi:hypothetical protein
MIARGTFFSIAAFWITMNILLWHEEYGARGSGIPIPVDLVWRKILTAPDASSLSVYQDGQRSGFCEFSTSVEQEMAKLDEDNPPPEGVATRAGYQIRLDGNISLGDFTNRVRFDGRLQFSSTRDWHELNLKIFTHAATVEIHSLALDQIVNLKITGDGAMIERDIPFADLQNPNALLRSLTGGLGGWMPGGSDLFVIPPTSTLPQNLHWEAHRDRLKIGREMVSVYRLETQLLQNKIVIYVSTLGEILRVELPGGITAAPDEWSKS